MKKNSTIKVKNTMPDLLAALWHHPDCPKWLQDEIWESFNDRIGDPKYTATYWASQLESAGPHWTAVLERADTLLEKEVAK